MWQVKTGVDYGHGHAVATFLSGALNYQIVHHLFPSVSQVLCIRTGLLVSVLTLAWFRLLAVLQYHYPAIAPIVREVCEQFKLAYNVLPDFSTAFHLHLKHLKEMGAQHKRPHLD
jgi:hypothetical protein